MEDFAFPTAILGLFCFIFLLSILYRDIADQQCCDGFRWIVKGLSPTLPAPTSPKLTSGLAAARY